VPSPKFYRGILAIALLICVAVACKQLQSLGRPTVLTSPDGKFQLTVPAGWQERPSLHAKATIKAANPFEETYVIVISENKIDFASDMTLDTFTDLTRRSMLSKVTEGDSTPPLPVKISGNDGRQYVLEGVVDNIRISYVITAVETAEHYHQIITWTLRSRIDQKQATLLKVTESFRPTDVAQGSSPASEP